MRVGIIPKSLGLASREKKIGDHDAVIRFGDSPGRCLKRHKIRGTPDLIEPQRRVLIDRNLLFQGFIPGRWSGRV